ncbi:MAG: outer membrane protein assembly factor BamE [Porticoccaceae bacterium]
MQARLFTTATALILTLLLTGCSWVPGLGVHDVTIQQGNIIDQEKVDQLLPGMSKAQVRYLLGTPLIADTFDQGRWDYYFSRKDSRGNRTQEQMTIHFDQDDKLVEITGDFQPQTP